MLKTSYFTLNLTLGIECYLYSNKATTFEKKFMPKTMHKYKLNRNFSF